MLPKNHKRCLLLLALVAVYGGVCARAASCTFKPPECASEDCVRHWQCERGKCGAESGCVCPPCYGGPACAEYEDIHPPTFRQDEDKLYVLPSQQGQVVYKAVAVDQDLITVCPKSASNGSPAEEECPCGVMRYSLVTLSPANIDAFVIDSVTGDVTMSAMTQLVVASGDTFVLQLTVTNSQLAGSPGHYGRMNLTVVVDNGESPSDEDADQLVHHHQDGDETLSRLSGGAYNVEPLPADLVQQSQSGVGAKDRQKRSSSGTGAGASEMMLTAVGVDPTTLNPGQSVTYDLTITLPTLTTAMDLLVEIFVMDAVTGITPFALCSVNIVSVGSAIKNSAGAAFDKSTVVVDLKANINIANVNDRAILNFGSLKNTGVADSGADKNDSTIKITFTASLIMNSAYTNTSAIVTAGAEYDTENYVWVSQASYGYTMSPGFSYPSLITINGADTAKQWGGATFTVDAIITDPVGPFTFEVYTPLSEHNKFTVSNIEIMSVGINMQCTGEPQPEYEYFYSVDKMTYHRGVAKFDLVMTGLQYPNLVIELSDMGNKVQIAFTVFFVKAEVGEIVSVGAGLSVGTTTLWTAIANVTIEAGAAPVAGTPTYGTVIPIGTDRTVAQFGTLTWGVPIVVPNGSNAAVSCEAAAGSHKVSGVVWGRAGGNIALRPNLAGAVTYDPALGATVWAFNINSTGQITGTDANTAILEVSVTYLTATVDAVTLSCNGFTIILTGGTTGANGTKDMTGTAEPVKPTDKIWYKGSQQALITRLTFPGGGSPYSKMEIQTSGDFDITTFGAEVCKVEFMSAGNGVPAIAGPMELLNSKFLFEKIQPTSIYVDGANLTLGPVAGSRRATGAPDSDYEVVLRMTYVIPKDQTTVTATTYNMSIGILLNTDLIWTGWSDFTTSIAVPTTTDRPVVQVIPPAVTALQAGRPTMVLVKLKMKPGSVDTYKVEASFPDTAALSICRIVFIAIGTSYPCLDPNPYGKELINLAQPNTIKHDLVNWGIKATVDLGVLRNVGYQEYYADTIADSDSIVLGVLVKGVVPIATPVALTVAVTHTGGPTTNTVPLTVSTPLSVNESVSAATWVPQVGTADAYAGVMKIIDLVLTFPVGYGHPLTVTIANAAPASMNLCFVAVVGAGKNMPCVIPHLVEVVVTETDVLQSHEIRLLETCQYEFVPNDLTENTVTLRMGVQFTKTGTSGTLTASILEGTVPSAVQPAPYPINLLTTPFDPASINTITEGFSVELANNATETVFPGSSMFYGINIILPPDTTGKVEIGAMAPTDGGRAYATLHSFRWANVTGKNVGCPMDPLTGYYNVQLLQNSSLGIPMIHTSQTDTMVIDIGYLTNTGVTYMQKKPIVPDDNVIGMEIEIMMADHINATTNSIIPISIAVKFGDVIYVVTKNLTIVRNAALDLMVLRSEVNFTVPEPSPLFDRVTKKQIAMTIRMSHVMNQSRQEANDAIVRILLPRPVQFVTAVDTQNSNITYNFTNNHYLDFSITNLFFTDYLEINATVTVDPLNDMVKGLGVINAAALVRLVCTTYAVQATVKYCGTTSILPFQIDGSECYENLGVATMLPCQFSASTAIKATTGPEHARTTGTGWSPAVRTGPGWDHHITIDFLKKTRVTKIVFTPVAGHKTPANVKLQYSHNGITFTTPCPNVLAVAVDTVLLPPECKFEARYGRLIIVDGAPDATAFGVKFEWHGCPIDTVADTCHSQPTTFTDSPGWRQIAFDATNGVFYFCDYSPKKKKNVCFSTKDGATWNALPAYIGSLVGADATTKLFYARDAKGVATVSSNDGINWMVVDQTTAGSIAITALDVSGEPSASFVSKTAGAYSADFTGIMFGGAYVAKWESCCS